MKLYGRVDERARASRDRIPLDRVRLSYFACPDLRRRPSRIVTTKEVG
jgi:hypothetical protein